MGKGKKKSESREGWKREGDMWVRYHRNKEVESYPVYIPDTKKFPIKNSTERLVSMSKLELRPWHNTERLSAICNTPIADWQTRDFAKIFEGFGFEIGEVTVIEEEGHPERWAIYIDNGADIIGVSHLDSVVAHLPENHILDASITRMHTNIERTRLYNPFLDDRLGVYTLLQTLPYIFQERGLTELPYDILLTIDEESGRSTASLLTELPEGKEYKWGFEFDAGGGTDAKVYQYRESEWANALEEVGYRVDNGSYSDIAYLGHLGVSMMNVACGYYSYHSRNAYFIVEEYDLQLARFVKFWTTNKDTKFEHVDDGRGRKSRWYDDYDWDNYAYYTGSSTRYRSKSTYPSTTASSGTSYTPKGQRTLGTHKVRDWSWLEQGTPDEDYTQWLQTVTLKSGASMQFRTYFYIGGEDVQGFDTDYIEAGYCADCGKPHLVEELVMERGKALCPNCMCSDDISRINLMQDWLASGGAVMYSNGKHERIIGGFDTSATKKCSLCNAPEWADKFVTVNIPGIEPFEACRWCAESIEDYEFEDVDEDDEMLELDVDTPETSIVLYNDDNVVIEEEEDEI